MTDTPCPCGTGLPYPDCCGQYHQGKPAPTPEKLMRSRYSAFVLHKINYIKNTMQKSALVGFDPEETAQWLKNIEWQGLEVLKAKTLSPDKGQVSFIARFTENNQPKSIAEKSKFQKIKGRWYYVKGLPIE